MLPIRVKYKNEDIPRLSMPNKGDIGIDLYAAEDVVMTWGQVALIPTGVSIEVPEGYALILKDRSSVSKHGHVLAGVIDNSYRGEIMIRMFCVGTNDTVVEQRDMRWPEGSIGNFPKENYQNPVFKISKGDKIAQALIVHDLIPKFRMQEVDELSDSLRGVKGFGSTGK